VRNGGKGWCCAVRASVRMHGCATGSVDANLRVNLILLLHTPSCAPTGCGQRRAAVRSQEAGSGERECMHYARCHQTWCAHAREMGCSVHSMDGRGAQAGWGEEGNIRRNGPADIRPHREDGCPVAPILLTSHHHRKRTPNVKTPSVKATSGERTTTAFVGGGRGTSAIASWLLRGVGW